MIEYEDLAKSNAIFQEEYRGVFNDVLRTGRFILGEQLRLFEIEFAKFCGSKYCIGVASGLDALYLSLKVLNLPKGSEIIVPSNTYIATILSIIQAGFKPVLVEPRLSTYNIDPALLEAKITKHTKAIMVVHLYGQPCEMEQILNVANRFNLPVIEDCAQAHGAKFRERTIGSLGTLSAFSFYPTKNLGSLGDGGAITTDNEEHANRLYALRNYGSNRKYINNYIGINSRLDELQAAFLRIKLKRLREINSHKQELANLYYSRLNKDKFILPVVIQNVEVSNHIFAIRHKDRDALKTYLASKEIGTEIHYPIPPHKQIGYREYFPFGYFPVSELIHNSILSLPISYYHTKEDISFICDVMNQF